jgi:hypothetical protein
VEVFEKYKILSLSCRGRSKYGFKRCETPGPYKAGAKLNKFLIANIKLYIYLPAS